MATRMTPAQLQSKLRQIQNQQKQAIAQYNREVQKHNQAVRQHNQNVKRAITNINNAIRQHNTKVRQARTQIESELRRLSQQPVRVTTTYTLSVKEVHSSYEKASAYYDNLENPSVFEDILYTGIEEENANNLATAYAIINDDAQEGFEQESEDLSVSLELSRIAMDLADRWKGAVFSLSPHNPDATRHFCTSAREIFAEMLNIKAPDALVLLYNPNCEKTPEKETPTRRAKIQYLIEKQGSLGQTAAEEFVDNNIKSILELIHDLSGGTHGPAGKFSLGQLLTVKKRVAGGLKFLCSIVV